ncbi:MAG: fold, partial [Verrucomicrobiaceae bacterium]|nr:fold [Verrucomicrobiaceae bacterium]
MESYGATFAYDSKGLATCDSEPIQYCGAIQSFGW